MPFPLHGRTFSGESSLGYEFSSGSVLVNNSWQLAVTADASDFVDLSEQAALEPRQADGSLPDNGFARLRSHRPGRRRGSAA